MASFDPQIWRGGRGMTVVDPTETGDDAKFMCHSMTPNFNKHWDKTTELPCLKATTDIKPGRLMTWHYGGKAVEGQPWAKHTTACRSMFVN